MSLDNTLTVGSDTCLHDIQKYRYCLRQDFTVLDKFKFKQENCQEVDSIVHEVVGSMNKEQWSKRPPDRGFQLLTKLVNNKLMFSQVMYSMTQTVIKHLKLYSDNTFTLTLQLDTFITDIENNNTVD